MSKYYEDQVYSYLSDEDAETIMNKFKETHTVRALVHHPHEEYRSGGWCFVLIAKESKRVELFG